MDRLGCYRPEEHIDNPKGYDAMGDPQQYDRRLRGRIDERRELTIDHETGMKNYIASEKIGITTSAGLVRKLFGQCIQLGRRYNRNGNKADLYEALRLLGTGCHCLEDFSAHSNYTELALIELGERNIFPHVGRNTQIQLRGARRPVYPLITGTFGGVDFLHSVTGEFDDKATQSEIQELENTMQQAQQNQGSTSILQDLLNKLPSGIFGDKDEAGKADELKQNAAAHQMANTSISPRQPEEWAQYLDDTQKQIYPIIEFHDEIMQSITETIEKIPILPDILESLTDQLNIFVFSLIAPFILPIINQVKTELTTGSSAIIQSSVDEQHIVFRDDNSSDPTHSMLSKDHFSNVLNEPAGKVAGQVLKWVVPQLMAAWDDERIDIDRTMNRIIQGVMHHPALRDQGSDGSVDGRRLMFGIVQQWWGEKSEEEKDSLRDQLSREGVEEGRNHKPGVVDHGHGSCKPLGMPGMKTSASSGAPAGSGGFMGSSGNQPQLGNLAAQAVGGGALGGLVGGLVSNIGGSMLGGDLQDNQQTFNRTSYGDDGSQTNTITQIGQSGNRYGQAQYSRTEDRYGGHTEELNRYEQTSTGGRYQSQVHHEESSSYGGFHEETRRYGGGRDQDEGFSTRRHEPEGGFSSGGYGRHENPNPDFGSGGYGRRTEEEPEFGSGRYGRQDVDAEQYGRHQQQDSGYRVEGRHGRRDEDGFGRRDYEPERTPEYGGGNRYGERQSDFGRRHEDSGFQNRDDEPHVPGGFGEEEEAPSYGRGHGRRHEEPAEEPEESYGDRRYGRRQDDEGDEDRGFGGMRGDDENYDRSSRRRYGEDNEESGGYGY